MRMLCTLLALGLGAFGCADSECPDAADYTALKAYSGPYTCQALTHATARGTFNVVPACTVDHGTCLKGTDLRYWQRDLGTPHVWAPRFWPGSSDSQAIGNVTYHSRLDAGATVQLDRVYTISQSMYVYSWITYRGGGIKRACSPRATLTADVDAAATCLPVNTTDGFAGNQPILVVPDASYHPSRWTLFTASGTVPGTTSLCLAGPIGNSTTAGAYAIMAFPMIVQVESNGTTGPTPGMVIEDMEIDGSASCNDGTHDWRFNDVGAIKAATLRRVWVHDTPSEGFTICGSVVSDNRGERLGGSFVHKSCSLPWHDTIVNNRVRGANLFRDSVMGHSEGVITLSANGGNMRVAGNTFADGQEGAFGLMNGDDEGIVAEGNVFSTFARRYEFGSGTNTIDVARNAWIGVP